MVAPHTKAPPSAAMVAASMSELASLTERVLPGVGL
jgi:hypothetical protein